MVDISGLNPPQYAAVTTIDGPVMILAGAGTGKTRVITYRMAHMMENGILPTQIVALTFTNKAAKEMKERVGALVGKGVKGLTVGTFHSFCIKLLRRFHIEAGLDARFALAGTSDQVDLVRRALDEKGWSGLYKAEDLLSRISRAKNALLTPENMLEKAEINKFIDEDLELLAAVYELYERQLKLNRVIDFDDCILKTALLLEREPSVSQTLAKELTHFLVDEFQDTNFAQLRILEFLAKTEQNICVVGDDDQSIYSWRGAMVETLDRFEQIFPSVKLIKLEQNYRCTNIILGAANEVIRNNKGRKDKTLWSNSDSEEYISLGVKADDSEEAKWIGDKIFGLLGRGYKPSDIGILYRANAQSRALEIALRERNIPYKIFGGTSFFERKEVRDFLAYFRLSVDPHDRMSFWRVINTPARGIGIKTLERIEDACRKHRLSPYAALEQNKVELSQKVRADVEDFLYSLKKAHGWPLANPKDLHDRGLSLIKDFELDRDIKHKTTHEGARKRKLESLHRLPRWIEALSESQKEDRGQINIVDLLDRLMLDDDQKNKNENAPENSVSLMTIHASKGLEFPAVFVCGLEDELLPHKNSLEVAHGIAEERRLFYVALTRAKTKLHLSYARERYSNFQKQARRPSRFLKELPEKNVVTDAKVAALSGMVSEEERKANSLKKLSKLRDSLKSGFQ